MVAPANKEAEIRFILDNRQIAEQLEEIARRLDPVETNAFRTAAYRRAAETLRQLDKPLVRLVANQGEAGLLRLPGIGRTIARQIAQSFKRGYLPLLKQLREPSREALLTSVAEIGPELAHRIHEHLGIESLGELQAAAHDGRLARVPGFGPKRVRAVKEALAGRGRLSRLAPQVSRVANQQVSQPAHPSTPTCRDEPTVQVLLDIDREYREKAASGRLSRVAPRRFNPTGGAWLPILRTTRGGEHFTALYSNTARAHELGATHDWVIIYRDEPGRHDQWTVITGQFGKLKDRRLVRGREAQCDAFYAESSTAAQGNL